LVENIGGVKNLFMARVGKIFDNTASGKTLSKRRDIAIEKCKSNNHLMGDYTHVKKKNENYLQWNCAKCSHSLIMNFLTGEETGGALIHTCRESSWL
jgi:hypothetical protein